MVEVKKRRSPCKRRPARKRAIRAVDVFCGLGGLTRGLEKSGIDVRLGVDIDPVCEYPYTANNNAKFVLKSVADLSGADLKDAVDASGYKLLAGLSFA
jgi:DNA (cytosine-5)-methyltransferase 1